MKVPLSGKYGVGKFAIIDAEDAEKVIGYKWHVTDKGYARRSTTVNHRTINIRMHHLILAQKPGKVTDHINHNRLDNRKANLRLVTPIENNYNRKIGLKYYFFDKSKNLWKVSVKKKYVGGFKTKSEAIIARDNYLNN